jgi:hypothetical protein
MISQYQLTTSIFNMGFDLVLRGFINEWNYNSQRLHQWNLGIKKNIHMDNLYKHIKDSLSYTSIWNEPLDFAYTQTSYLQMITS